MNIASDNITNSLLSTKIEKLESSVKKLVLLCEKLSSENNSFKQSNKQLTLERSQLQSKNDKARTQIEAMLDRLKSAEKAS